MNPIKTDCLLELVAKQAESIGWFPLGINASAFTQQNYDPKNVCLTKQLARAESLNSVQTTATPHQENWMQHV